MLDDPYLAFCLDEAASIAGQYAENRMHKAAIEKARKEREENEQTGNQQGVYDESRPVGAGAVQEESLEEKLKRGATVATNHYGQMTITGTIPKVKPRNDIPIWRRVAAGEVPEPERLLEG